MTSNPHDRRSEAPSPRGVLSATPRQTPGGFEQRLLARAGAAGFTAGDRLLVGFSGGRDSLALAAALRWSAARLGFTVLLVHVDHRLRRDSAEDALRAATLADRLALPIRVVALPDVPTAAHPGVGVEEAARRERYRVLLREGEEAGASAIATAHHRDDQAETVLLHLLRGGGVHGAAGMAEVSMLPCRDTPPGGPHNISPEIGRPWLWRPLLQESRAGIDAYVRELGLEPIEDPTNASPDFRRNLLRGTILPLIEAAFPGAGNALARYARLAAEDDRTLETIAAAAMSGAVDRDGALRAASLAGEPLAVRRRMVRRWLQTRAGIASISAERTEALLELAARGAGGRAIELGEGWRATWRRGALHLDRVKAEPGRGA